MDDRRKPEPPVDPFQRREWTVQRIGWAAMAAFVAAALVGLFGSGPLSESTVAVPVGVSGLAAMVDFDRYARYDTGTLLTVRLEGQGDTPLELAIDSEWLGRYAIESIQPEPLSSAAAGANTVFRFAVTGAPTRIFLRLRPQRVGGSSTRLALGGSSPVIIRQFVYP